MCQRLGFFATLLLGLLVPEPARSAGESDRARLGIEARQCTTVGSLLGADKISILQADLWGGTCELTGTRLVCMTRFHKPGVKKLGTGEAEFITAYEHLSIDGEAAVVFTGDGHNSTLILDLQAERFSYTTMSYS